MNIDKAKVEFYLNELKKRGEEITGGTPGKKRPSYILRDPEFYWEFGSFLVEQAQKVSEDERSTWIRKKTKKIEIEILGNVSNHDYLVPKIWSYADHLQEKDHFMYVANIAGHKFKKFRIKVLGYTYDIYSKKEKSEYTDTQKNKLAEQLQVDGISHKDVNFILSKFRGKSNTSLGYGIKNDFENLLAQVEDSVESENFENMKSLKSEIGIKMIDKLRIFLQIIPLPELSLFKEVYDSQKTVLSKKTSTKNKLAEKLAESFGNCAKDDDLRNKILKKIGRYEMGLLNNYLDAIKTEENYQDWKRTKESFEQMGDD